MTTLDLPTLWWLLAAVLLIVEMLTGTVYLLLIAVACAAAALAAYAGVSASAQVLTAALIGCALVLAWWRLRRMRLGKAPARPPAADVDLNLDIGQTVMVDSWQADGTACVMHRGARWTAVRKPATAGHHDTGVPGPHRIVALDGSRLVVAPLAR